VPLDGATFAESKSFAHAIAMLVADRLPELIVTTIAKPRTAATRRR
jgi:DNA primase